MDGANRRREKAEEAISFVMRFIVSSVMPLWGAAMVILGAMNGSAWWIGTGAAVIGVGLLFSVGSPLIEPFVRKL